MRSVLTIFLLLFLAACGRDVRNLRLEDVDLADMAVVQSLGRELAPTDRVAFTTFVAVHAASPGRSCGVRLGGPDGKEPETIGEAIVAMHERTARMERLLIEARKPVAIAPG
jgi:hypothetical protein